MTLSVKYNHVFLESINACQIERTESFLSFLPKGWSEKSRTSYIYSGLGKDDFPTEEDIPKSFENLLTKTNGLRLFGGSLVLYGLLDGRDKFGERDGPVPISIEDKTEIFRHSKPSLWNDGFRPVGAIAENRLEPLLGSLNSDSVFVLDDAGIPLEMFSMDLLIGEFLDIFRRVALGELDIRDMNAARLLN